jgi:mannose-1-phosphate guanylyltransferase
MAEKGFLVTYGIIPDRPETGYGYIKIGDEIGKEKGIVGFHGKGFTEKPSIKKAREYLKTKKYLWNSGIFTYRISTILDEIKKVAPGVYTGVKNYLKLKDKRYFERISGISIDYAVMEKSKKICVIKANFDWDDVGSYLALERYFKKDKYNNIFLGDILGLETNHSIVYTNNVPVRVYGINGLVVVANPKGVLVCKKERTPDLKKLFSNYKKEKKRRL